MLALSVSISTSGAPRLTSPPTSTSHFRTVPSSIESDSRGMFTSVAIYTSRNVESAALTTCSSCGNEACSSGLE